MDKGIETAIQQIEFKQKQVIDEVIDQKTTSPKSQSVKTAFPSRTVQQLKDEWDTLGPLLQQDFKDYAQGCIADQKRPDAEYFFKNVLVPENTSLRFRYKISFGSFRKSPLYDTIRNVYTTLGILQKGKHKQTSK